MSKKGGGREAEEGRLRIGDDWNAISIIALSQSNPLKAVAEFVENSIDAGARVVTVTRGKERGENYLRIADDGAGIYRDAAGLPDFRHVATHICDSIKRKLKAGGAAGIQGEFGIGLLSFWTVGGKLTITSAGADGRAHQMRLAKGDPGFSLTARRSTFAPRGTELDIRPLLPGLRHLSGEKINWYLSSELRDRIRTSGVKIRIVDRQARAEFFVEPRQFSGRLLHQLPPVKLSGGDVYLEIYLAEASGENLVALYRSGTRVLESVTLLDAFQGAPWTSGRLQGMVDAPGLNLTPGTRSGVIQDGTFAAFCAAVKPVENALSAIIEEQRRAEEERASEDILRSIKRALKEALRALPDAEYDWFDLQRLDKKGSERPGDGPKPPSDHAEADGDSVEGEPPPAAQQKEFFEFTGPLFSVRASPASTIVSVGAERRFRAVALDRKRLPIEEGVSYQWEIVEGGGTLSSATGEFAAFTAPKIPGLVRLRVTAAKDDLSCSGEALATVTDSLLPKDRDASTFKEGIPDYTFHRAPGEAWRSRYDAAHNVVVINNGHRDFVFAARSRALKLRYLVRLFAKELVLKNFPGAPAEELLERMIEVALYTEENLK